MLVIISQLSLKIVLEQNLRRIKGHTNHLERDNPPSKMTTSKACQHWRLIESPATSQPQLFPSLNVFTWRPKELEIGLGHSKHSIPSNYGRDKKKEAISQMNNPLTVHWTKHTTLNHLCQFLSGPKERKINKSKCTGFKIRFSMLQEVM